MANATEFAPPGMHTGVRTMQELLREAMDNLEIAQIIRDPALIYARIGAARAAIRQCDDMVDEANGEVD